MTFFIGNSTSYIFWLDFFSLSCLGIKLGKVIGENPAFVAEWDTGSEVANPIFTDFGYVV